MTAFSWALLTACIWGMVPVLEKIGLSNVKPFTALFYRSIGVLLGLLILSVFLVKPSQLKAVDPRSIFLLILSGFLASFVAQICFYHGLKIGDVSRVTPVAGIYPLIAFVLGVFILGETITLAKIMGIVLIISGIFMLR